VRRVLHVCEGTIGGLGVFVDALARRQAADGLHVAVASPEHGPRAEPATIARMRAAGVAFHDWPCTPTPGPTVPREHVLLRRIVRSERPDVLHLHSTKGGFSGRLVARARTPTIHQPHAWSFFAKTGLVGRLTLQWERLGARWTTVVLCVSEDERRLGLASGVRAEYRVIVNGADLERWPAPAEGERGAARAALGLPADVPLCVLSARLHRQKGQHRLLDAWPHVRARVPEALCVLVGDGPDRADLEARGVEGVRLVGHQGEVRPWLVAADVVAAPSLWEGMSLSVLEALACARPVVATDVPGMAEVVDGEVGALVASGDAAALGAALAERLADPDRAAREGAAARARIEARHDRAAQFAAIEGLYEELLARG
jgi:glycosyltransferase involved in cell wall biosynthesis